MMTPEKANLILDWIRFYEEGPVSTRNYMLFGSNTEVEEPLIERDQTPQVFDDRKTRTACGLRCVSWTVGFDTVRNNPEQHFLVMVGVCSTPAARMAAVKRVEDALSGFTNWTWYTVRSGDAKISLFSRIGQGVLILDGAYIAPDCDVEDFAVLLPGARLYHHSTLGEGSILVGGSIVLGRTIIGRRCWICGHATVLPGGFIADDQVIGAGATVKQIGSPEVK